MTVKAKRGRRRYVAFCTDPLLDREKALHRMRTKKFLIVQCAEGMAVVRCAPDQIAECTEAFRMADPDACSVAVSGTLRTLRDRYPVLRRTAPPKPRRPRSVSFPLTNK